MYFDGPEQRKIRLIMHRTILRQFLEAYSKPIYEWCDKHGIEHTGHYMEEDSFLQQIGAHYGSVMQHYRYQHAPGIDHLCRMVDNVLFTCKQVASVARQMGRTRVLDEIFGVSRHTNTFEHFKWQGDYDLVLGANFFVPHLTWYSARGRRKRDYPPVWNYQQTYWNDLKPLNDYFARVAHALTRGKAQVDVLILQSIESATSARRLGVELSAETKDRARKLPVDVPTYDSGAMHEYDRLMRKTLEAILNAGYDSDIGEESYIEEMGAVEGDRFRIGQMSYKVVILPPATTWKPKTFELLKQFAGNGGKVIMLSDFPIELDCEDAREKWAQFAELPNVQSLPCSIDSIQNAIDVISPQSFTLRGADGTAHHHTFVQHRIDGDQEIFFITNSDRTETRDYVLTLKDGIGKSITVWDPVEGTCWSEEGHERGEDLVLEFCLPPVGSLLLTVGAPVHGAEYATYEEEDDAECECGHDHFETVTRLKGEFDFERRDANVLVIDRFSISYDGGKTFEKEDLDWRVRPSVARHFGTETALEWQPWVAIRKGLFDGKGGEIVIRYKFLSDLDKPKSFVVVEYLIKGKLTINGSEVDLSNRAWHWDREFGKVEVTPYVQKGENIVDFTVDFDFLTEVEPAYIVGDFGVTMADSFRGKIVAEPNKLKAGSWTNQGYPFYSGRMIYKTDVNVDEVRPTALRLVKPSGTLYKVRVNGRDAGTIMWRPFEIDLTEYLKPGKNLLEIQVVSSLQNSWGPLHDKEGEDYLWVGPDAFENEGVLREEINLFDYGLLGGVEIVTA